MTADEHMELSSVMSEDLSELTDRWRQAGATWESIESKFDDACQRASRSRHAKTPVPEISTKNKIKKLSPLEVQDQPYYETSLTVGSLVDALRRVDPSLIVWRFGTEDTLSVTDVYLCNIVGAHTGKVVVID
jgi:hypothetical protein